MKCIVLTFLLVISLTSATLCQVTWTARNSGTTKDFYGVNYCNNQYVAVGNNGLIFTSPDGVAWTSRTSGTTNILRTAIYANDKYVAVGYNGTIVTSSDGITWINRTSGTSNYLWNISYYNNLYVIVGSNGTILTSPDAITWTSRISGTTNWLYGLNYNNNQFIISGGAGTILTSPDGITWTSRTSGTTNGLYGIYYGENLYIAVSNVGTVHTSPDGITWTSKTSGTSRSLYGGSYGNNQYVIGGAGGTILSSVDGTTWSNRSLGISNYFYGICYGNNQYIAVGTGGVIYTSGGSIPLLIAPANAATNLETSPTLTWSPVSGAITYRIQVSTISTFATTVVDDSTLTTNSITLPPLTNNTTYYWRANAKTALGSGPWPVMRSFSTIIAAPGSITLTSPVNGTTNVASTPTLTWTTGTGGAAIYLVKVSTSSAFDSFVINDSTTSLSYGITTPFSNNTTYYWEVDAKNVISTVYSAMSRFTTIVAAPGSVIITTPENGAANVAITPTLEWTAGTGGTADKYLVKVSTSSTFNTLFINDSTNNTSYEIATALSNSTTYFWKVAAKNANSTSGYTSANFSTIVAAPGALTLTAPAFGATNVVVTPTLEWTPGTGGTPAQYLVKVSTSSDFSSLIVNDSTVNLNYPISTPLSNSMTYYWKVAAKNVNCTSSYATSNFSTIVAAPGALTLMAPAYGAINVAVTPTLEWTPGTGGTADKYLVKVSTNSDFSTLVINDSTINPSYEIATALSNNTRYYWEVAAKNANSIGSYSTSYFTTIVALPGAVTLISPTTNELNIPVLPTLTWTTGIGGAPVKYLVRISTSSDFSSTILNDSTAGAPTSYTLASALTYVNKYYWSVAAKNAAGTSDWVTDSFTTIKAETHFKFTSVTGNSMLILVKQDITPKVNGMPLSAGDEIGVFTPNGLCVGAKRWTGESNISIVAWGDNDQTLEQDGALPNDSLSFRIWDSTAAQEGLAKVTWQPVDHVIFTRAYTYGINTSAGLGSFAAIVASEVPALRLPVTNAAGISLTPTLTWSSALNAISYRVQVSSTSTFDYLNFNDSLAETSDLVSPALSYGIKYFWRVNATNAAGGISAWAIDSFTTTAQRIITLKAGWNIISLNVIPNDSSTTSVFSSMKNLVIVKNTEGEVYWPSMGSNTIGSVRLGEGYQVYTTAADTLIVIGTPVDVSAHPIALNTGWCILGYLSDADMPINSALDGISSAIKIVKNNIGEAYWPAFGINDIENMRVGQGYQVYLTSPATLTYPSVVYGLTKTLAVAAGTKLPKAKHFVYAGGSTGNNATLMLKTVVENNKPIADSSEIAVYSSSGSLVGSGVVINGKTAFPIWGDNPMTKDKDGLSASEALTFKVWTPSGEEFSGTYVGTGSNGYTQNALMEGALSVHRAAVITRCALANAYPNPFRGNVHIAFDVAAINGKDLQSVEINVYDVRGVLVHQIVKDQYKVGHYTVSWDGSDRLGSNMYIVQMKAEQFSQKMKLFRVK